ncbi:hypothetical protein EUX98_g4603 [Antrodiella citrinella]|uniref:Major facilitator superfamily (MFS) profile domain-containing protein n=1 Tax=Antrodiella citrinella TaxID=2447956 RepID=A0A4S4N1J4_9APHY|nr:hypothetical protein EUX98_g4603 [Antrodiella citrinella]
MSDSLTPSRTPTLNNIPVPFSPVSPPHEPKSHDRDEVDLSFPYGTTNVAEGGLTDEYRVTSETGLVSADLVLRPIPSHFSAIPTVLQDPEKAKHLRDVKLVTFLDSDPEDPRNFSNAYKWWLTACFGISVVSAAFASAVITGDFEGVEVEFHVGLVVTSLSVSLMVCGFGVGPLLWAPLSELYGRRPLWIIPAFIYVIFNIPCAVAPNIQTLLICRFFCGVFSSAPFAIAGGAIADIWDNDERGFAIALFAAAPYGGPVLGPIVGGFVGDAIGWRWIFWVNMIFAGAVFIMECTLPETYAPVILRRRAERLRKETGDENITTEQELFKASFAEMLQENMIRPFAMIVTEPILLLVSMYIALIYGLLYAFFFSFPITFLEDYHWNEGQTGVALCSIWVGLLIALASTPFFEGSYLRQKKAKGGKADPEDRLIGMMVGAPFIPMSMFIFGWTSPPIVMPGGGNWVGPVASGIPFGFGMVTVYFSANAYLIETFSGCVASALAAKTVIRSGSGAAMPLFITAMYHNLGTQWAASTWGFISLAMIPIPYMFYIYGKQIRSTSKRASGA